MLTVRAAVAGDVDQWLEIVREVEPLFGPMPDFARHAERAIARGTALVVTDGEAVVGACLLSRDDEPHEIRWLAVRESHRRRGVGSLLVREIEKRWPIGDIGVVTFTASTPGGNPARRLYESRGFELRGQSEPGPDGSPRDFYVLPAARRVKR